MKAQKVITLEDAHNLEALGHVVAIYPRKGIVVTDGCHYYKLTRRATDRQAYAARALSIETARLREQARAGTLYGRVIA